MNKTEMKEKVMQAIRNMNSNELYSLCLEFSDVNGGCDPVYSMDEVDDIYCDVPPSKIMEITRNSPEFSPYDEYFYEDSCGQLVSLSELNANDDPILYYVDEMVDLVVNEKNPLDNSTLESILNEEE